jgi:hypothetical protein
VIDFVRIEKDESYIWVSRWLSITLCGLAVFSFAISIYALVLAVRFPDKQNFGYNVLSPSAPIFMASCGKAEIWNIAVTIIVNIFGTVVLAISNYLQQLCTSPSAEDIATEFEKKGDATFGANSPCRLFQRKDRRWVMLIWIVLLVTSLPIHLLLNGGFWIYTDRHSVQRRSDKIK